MPIGNGHAPGIEIGRDATDEALGVEVAVDGGTEFVTTSFSGGVLATTMGAAGFFAAIVFVGFLAALRAAGRRPAAFFLTTGLATLLAGRLATRFAALFAVRFAGFLALDRTVFARLRATVLRALDLLAERFATVRLAAFFAADFFFAAICTSNDLERLSCQVRPDY